MNHEELRHIIAATALVPASAASVIVCSGRVRARLVDAHVGWLRRRYLTTDEQRELQRQRATKRTRWQDADLNVWYEQQAALRGKYLPDLFADPATADDLTEVGIALVDLTAAQLISRFRQAVAWKRTVETVCGPGCLDGVPVVRQWRDQVEALQSEFDRRTSPAVRRTLSLRERHTLRRAAFEIHDYEAQQLPARRIVLGENELFALTALFGTDDGIGR